MKDGRENDETTAMDGVPARWAQAVTRSVLVALSQDILGFFSSALVKYL
jgi:hypothetical protein